MGTIVQVKTRNEVGVVREVSGNGVTVQLSAPEFTGDTITVSRHDVEPAPAFLGNVGTVDGIPNATTAVSGFNADVPRFLDNLGTVDRGMPEPSERLS